MCSPGRTILKTGAKEPSSCLRDGVQLKLIGSGSGANLGDYWLFRANPAPGLSPSDALRLTLASRPRALRLNRPVADPAVACTALLEAMRSESKNLTSCTRISIGCTCHSLAALGFRSHDHGRTARLARVVECGPPVFRGPFRFDIR